VIELPAERRGLVLLPRRWVVERRFARIARFRRLSRSEERSAKTLAGVDYVALACVTLLRAFVGVSVHCSF